MRDRDSECVCVCGYTCVRAHMRVPACMRACMCVCVHVREKEKEKDRESVLCKFCNGLIKLSFILCLCMYKCV